MQILIFWSYLYRVQCCWWCRQNPKLAAELDLLVHMAEEETNEVSNKEDGPLPDLMVSQDRFAVYRATKLQSADTGSGEGEDGSSYSTGMSWGDECEDCALTIATLSRRHHS